MTKPDYVPGEHVTVRIDGAQVLEYSGERMGLTLFPAELVVQPRNGKDPVRLPIGERYGTTIERHIPVDGQPQPGELWRDARNELYFAKDNGAHGVSFVAPGNPTSVWALSWQDIHRESGPIRRVWSPSGGDTDAG